MPHFFIRIRAKSHTVSISLPRRPWHEFYPHHVLLFIYHRGLVPELQPCFVLSFWLSHYKYDRQDIYPVTLQDFFEKSCPSQSLSMGSFQHECQIYPCSRLGQHANGPCILGQCFIQNCCIFKKNKRLRKTILSHVNHDFALSAKLHHYYFQNWLDFFFFLNLLPSLFLSHSPLALKPHFKHCQGIIWISTVKWPNLIIDLKKFV